jgi:hypothetical protein
VLTNGPLRSDPKSATNATTLAKGLNSDIAGDTRAGEAAHIHWIEEVCWCGDVYALQFGCSCAQTLRRVHSRCACVISKAYSRGDLSHTFMEARRSSSLNLLTIDAAYWGPPAAKIGSIEWKSFKASCHALPKTSKLSLCRVKYWHLSVYATYCFDSTVHLCGVENSRVVSPASRSFSLKI